MQRRLKRRHAAEARFRIIGLVAVGLSLAFLAYLLFTMLRQGLGGLDWSFLTGSDSTEASVAGIWGAAKGSVLTMGVTLGLSFPLGVLAAVYLEEFAPKGRRWVEWVEVSINNLAAVPSIIFGRREQNLIRMHKNYDLLIGHDSDAALAAQRQQKLAAE